MEPDRENKRADLVQYEYGTRNRKLSANDLSARRTIGSGGNPWAIPLQYYEYQEYTLQYYQEYTVLPSWYYCIL